MGNWKSISLFSFQQTQNLNSNSDLSELDKVLFCVCAVYDYTPFQLDNMNWKRVKKMIAKITNIFSQPLNPKPLNRIGRFRMQYDFNKINFGQYVELAFFIDIRKDDPIQAAHYCLASVARKWWRVKHTSEGHKKRADYFLTKSIEEVSGSFKALVEAYDNFNKEYSFLFGLGQTDDGEEKREQDPFNRRYGWTFSAEEVMKYQGVTLEDTYGLPVREALGSLQYLKAKGEYMEKLMRESRQNKSNGGQE